jgi:dynein heavy chain, axonemal
MEATQNYLHDSFVASLQHTVTSSLDRIGKGWFNIHERSHDMYAHSKLRRLLTAIRFMMEDAVRSLVLRSVEAYATFMEAVCGQHARKQTTNQDSSGEPARAGVQHTKALLALTLQPASSGKGMEYKDDVASLPQRLTDLMLRSVAACQGLPQLEPLVLTKMTWAYKPKLAGVSLSDPVVLAAAQRVQHSWNTVLDLLKSHRSHFGRFDAILQRDNEAAVNELLGKGADLTLADVQSALIAAEKELADVKHGIPMQVCYMTSCLNNAISVHVRDVVCRARS